LEIQEANQWPLKWVTHGEIANVSGPCHDPIKNVFGRQQGPSGKGLDRDFAVGPLFSFCFPSLHLNAREGRGRRKVRIGQFDFLSECDRRRRNGKQGCNEKS
jgi:hypothetical protein